ncbi:N-sulfoglucosamine sulfohydrolase [Catalinimonas alkaloidigena]|uniref:sulfatase family protein n=1 Tax=Catalinimonas alkaloidigena TaxID=1075417 RepID=UPI0024076F11|nr:sulfatase [Catalinimonas alkaloidigena]MDF9798929.1 N-sulfoglucosamine sulfohydrolase [Catalinimonas alkaloidigena]
MGNSLIRCLLLPIMLFDLACQPDHKDYEQREMPPNMLLIVSEDHGPHLSCYGDTIISTPHLDQIAQEGVLFENAYVAQSVCSPSRSSILTGLYPHQNGQLGLATQGYHMLSDVENIYSLLKEVGYQTGMIGKLHVNPESSFPIDYHPITASNFSKKELGRYAAYADTMMRTSEKPFFLMVNLPEAHYPWQNSVDGYPEDPILPEDVTPFAYIGFDNERIRNVTASYYNCLLRLDKCIGELMEALEHSGKEENTLVIYLSDHGDEMARGKFDVYEASTKVPFLVKWPGKIKPGRSSGALISSVDIVPTILDVVGLTIPEKVSGKSLIPLFEDTETDFREYLFTEYNCDPILYFPRRAVRDHQYKLIYSLLQDRKNESALAYTENRSEALDGSPTREEIESAPDSIQEVYSRWINSPEIQLFDLINDPWEFRDLADDTAYVEVKERLLQALKQWQEATDDPLRDNLKLEQLSQEHDTVYSYGFKDDWEYPRYLYHSQ